MINKIVKKYQKALKEKGVVLKEPQISDYESLSKYSSYFIKTIEEYFPNYLEKTRKVIAKADKGDKFVSFKISEKKAEKLSDPFKYNYPAVQYRRFIYEIRKYGLGNLDSKLLIRLSGKQTKDDLDLFYKGEFGPVLDSKLFVKDLSKEDTLEFAKTIRFVLYYVASGSIFDLKDADLKTFLLLVLIDSMEENGFTISSR